MGQRPERGKFFLFDSLLSHNLLYPQIREFTFQIPYFLYILSYNLHRNVKDVKYFYLYHKGTLWTEPFYFEPQFH